PPRWNIVWNGIAVNRSSSRLGNGNRSSMNKIKIGMVEIIAIKIINSRTECSGSHESIELFVFEKASRTSINLITVILADDSLIVIRVIRFADIGNKQQFRIVKDITG